MNFLHFDFFKYCIKNSFILFTESFGASLNCTYKPSAALTLPWSQPYLLPLVPSPTIWFQSARTVNQNIHVIMPYFCLILPWIPLLRLFNKNAIRSVFFCFLFTILASLLNFLPLYSSSPWLTLCVSTEVEYTLLCIYNYFIAMTLSYEVPQLPPLVSFRLFHMFALPGSLQSPSGVTSYGLNNGLPKTSTL